MPTLVLYITALNITGVAAGLAYLLLPVTGLFASLSGRTPRTRFHGYQAVILGALWPLFLIAASKISPAATKVAFVAGALVWLGYMLPALFGADPRLPLIGRTLQRAAEPDPKAR